MRYKFTKSPTARFYKYISKSDHPLIPFCDCWVWIGDCHRDGYGRFRPGGSAPSVQAHRFSYELFNGPIPDGMKVLHSCDYHPCVNPNHLFLGTQKDNMQDMIKKGRKFVESIPQKLSVEKVREIRSLIKQGITQKKIARNFGISQQTVSDIATRKIWKRLS